jgi:hypothetical protein
MLVHHRRTPVQMGLRCPQLLKCDMCAAEVVLRTDRQHIDTLYATTVAQYDFVLAGPARIIPCSSSPLRLLPLPNHQGSQSPCVQANS